MSDRKLRWGIMGTGNIAGQFCAGVIGSKRCALVAVGSRTASTARLFSERNSISDAHETYDDLIANPNVDAVYISLPNSLHHEWTIKALRAGKHVLCEKPLAVTVREAEEMFDESRRAKHILVEAFMYRSHPQTHALVKAVRDGAIGQLKLIRTNFCFRIRNVEGNIRFRPELAGGALMDVGCYCLNLSRLIAGSEPDQIDASSILHPSGVDESTTASMRFPNGVLANFTCGMNVQADNAAHICGTDGYIVVDWPWKPADGKAGFVITQGVPPKQDTGTIGTAPPPAKRQAFDTGRDLFSFEADDFAASVLDGAQPTLSEKDSIGNTRLLEMIRKKVGLKF